MSKNIDPNNNSAHTTSKKAWIIAIIICGITLFFLAFHIVVTNSVHIFPKEHLSFNKTFITQSDINEEIRRFNTASLFEQLKIRQEYLVRKYFEFGFIEERNYYEDIDYDFNDDSYNMVSGEDSYNEKTENFSFEEMDAKKTIPEEENWEEIVREYLHE